MKIGFEIHQQLDTSKLFCSSPSILREEDEEFRIMRRLRPSQSELGAIDEAAMKEFLKGKNFIYKGYNDSICLVELDEEPPRGPNSEAVDISLTIASMLKAEIVDEIHFMRKVVIDGSNTGGFQRTAIIAFDGYLETKEGRIRIPTICLEEEAARKVGEEENSVIYNLDRLGISLIEITTAPDIKSPKQAREAALKIGELLRATGRVKRGIGTIRQDINVSIEGGVRVEIKGVQDLNTIPRLIESEVERQKGLITIKKRLEKRGVDSKNQPLIKDVTEVFSKTDSKIIRAQLKRGRVIAVKLMDFGGLLGGGLLGREIAEYVRTATGVKGIFHSDELPGYGISRAEANQVNAKLKMKDADAFIIVAEAELKARKAIKAAIDRAYQALEGPLEETRSARGDTTEYMRPLPGSARMYPETDIPPYLVVASHLEGLQKKLPEDFEAMSLRLSKDFGISTELSGQLARSQPSLTALFEKRANQSVFSGSNLASIFLSFRKPLESGILSLKDASTILDALEEGQLSKEAIPEILDDLKNGKVVSDALKSRQKGEVDLEMLVNALIKKKRDFILEKGIHAEKPLMGLIMKEARGKVDGKVVNELLKKKLESVLSKK